MQKTSRVHRLLSLAVISIKLEEAPTRWSTENWKLQLGVIEAVVKEMDQPEKRLLDNLIAELHYFEEMRYLEKHPGSFPP